VLHQKLEAWVVGFTTGSRGKVPGKICEKRRRRNNKKKKNVLTSLHNLGVFAVICRQAWPSVSTSLVSPPLGIKGSILFAIFCNRAGSCLACGGVMFVHECPHRAQAQLCPRTWYCLMSQILWWNPCTANSVRTCLSW
jgi:hypothetical protein